MNPEDLLRGLKPTGAPADLRARVLDAARAAALAPEAPRRSWVDRLWESRHARRAWAACVTLLVLGHWALSLARAPAGPSAPEIGGPPPETAEAMAAVWLDRPSSAREDWLEPAVMGEGL